MGGNGSEGGQDDDYYEVNGLDEDIIPGDNDLPGFPQLATGSNVPPNPNAPNNLTHVADQDVTAGKLGAANIRIESPVSG